MITEGAHGHIVLSIENVSTTPEGWWRACNGTMYTLNTSAIIDTLNFREMKKRTRESINRPVLNRLGFS